MKTIYSVHMQMIIQKGGYLLKFELTKVWGFGLGRIRCLYL